jgi:hypothetical protein
MRAIKRHSKSIVRTTTTVKDGVSVEVPKNVWAAACPNCSKLANRLHWINLDGDLSEPYCLQCLYQKARLLESEDGAVPGIPIYSYSTSIAGVTQAREVAKEIERSSPLDPNAVLF